MKAYGTPLPAAHPASVEEFIIDRVRADIGKELLPSVTLKPSFEIERAPGDLSGDLTNAYGTIEVKVGERGVFLPFMIVDKELMPFETIRLGDQQVGYAPERIRTIIQNLLLKQDGEEGDDELVSRQEVTSNNGFLGTVMHIRDDENLRNMMNDGWRGDTFGDINQARLFNKSAGEEVDTLQTLEKIADIIEGATFISKDDVEQFLDKVASDVEIPLDRPLEKQAAYEEEKARRLQEQIEQMKLVNYDKHRSGNNVLIPLFDELNTTTRFETTRGRVYTKFHSLIGNQPSMSGMVIASDKEFALLDSRKQLMTFRDKAPESFEPVARQARTMKLNHLYTFEQDTESIAIPFRIRDSFVASFRNRFTVGHQDTYATAAINKPNSLFSDLFSAQEYDANVPKSFAILLTDRVEVPEHLTMTQVFDYIDKHAKDEDDNWLAKMMVKTYQSKEFVLIPERMSFYELSRPLKHTYDSPKSIVPDRAFSKTAAYNQHNVLTLKSEGYRKPETFRVEWSFVEPVGEGSTRTERVRKAFEKNLSRDAANNLLLLLGVEHYSAKTLFQTLRRTGREASIPLPDIQKARDLSRDEMGRREKMKRKQSLLSRTINNSTYGNELSNILSFGIATAIDTAGGSKYGAGVDAFMKQSAELAGALEKIATSFVGEQWMELAVLSNIKHRLDKVACAIESGDLVADADGLFKEAAALAPKIEKLAHDLVPYNRLQRSLPRERRVDAGIVKSAQQMLDVLYGYATLEKSAGIFDKVQAFSEGAYGLGKRTLTRLTDPHGAALSQADEQVEQAYAAYKDATIAAATGQDGDVSGAESALRAAFAERNGLLRSQADHDAKVRTALGAGVSGVTFPGIAGVIGYRSAQEES